jgi:hypothetical protein
MKQVMLLITVILLAIPLVSHGDDVIPSVAKEDMKEYKNTFGKAISESRKAEREKEAREAKDANADRPDNFGQKVSDAARNSKEEILKDNKNFGAWVSQQRSQRPDEAGANRGNSNGAKSSVEGGRPKAGQNGRGRGRQ